MSYTSTQIREMFFKFFESKDHKIVPSAPIVVKDDPTLMFTNAGMNQFKDFFLGNKTPDTTRMADTQKCLRVSGKHNDLEEVGRDSYHHTMFEMLGNWSFGDYFKKEAIAWAWELLVDVYKLDKDRLYVTVFEGDKNDGLEADEESVEIWAEFIDRDKILYFDRKDNFWEMGDSGPCGPCSEIHIDLRNEEDRAILPGDTLVNKDHPLVIEIWNLVFIQFNRKANGALENLPAQHVDTGMGFERLTMALQAKKSNYDSDIFSPFIEMIEKETGIEYTHTYTNEADSDTAMRVLVDHLRAVSFTIADGQMPDNTGAGYVIRRILRRAVRYYYSFLNIKAPFIHKMVPMLAQNFKAVFPELDAQKDFVAKVILEEEKGFLRTLEGGLKRLDNIEIKEGLLDGNTAFELYDTYGFPIDLTMLIAEEKDWKVDIDGFNAALEKQRARGRADAKRTTGDWILVNGDKEVEFVGYDSLSVTDVEVIKYRTIEEKEKEFLQVVISKSPFYAEGGGQVGDAGYLDFDGEIVKVIDTKKENDLIILHVDHLPQNIDNKATAVVDQKKRALTENNHSATHLMHAALKNILGDHVQQKGSLVKEDILRFDFSHFQKMTDEEIAKVEELVNSKIRENIKLEEARSIPKQEAMDAGATMLFGEKYGEEVRMITFDPNFSRELCGGCHVDATGKIGLFKITSETAIAAGVRRITAVTADGAESYINGELQSLNEIKSIFKNPQDLMKTIKAFQDENRELKKQIEQLSLASAANLQDDLKAQFSNINGINVLATKVDMADSKAIKTMIFNLEKEVGEAAILIANENEGKAQLQLLISKSVVASKELKAGAIIRDLASHIKGGGGGQDSYASAGGSDPSGIDAAVASFNSIME